MSFHVMRQMSVPSELVHHARKRLQVVFDTTLEGMRKNGPVTEAQMTDLAKGLETAFFTGWTDFALCAPDYKKPETQ